MTDDRLPCDIEREEGNAAYAARHGNSPKLNTAPPLDGRKLREWQAMFRKKHGLMAIPEAL